jgi:GNAT superfamily N-acetyltransferase
MRRHAARPTSRVMYRKATVADVAILVEHRHRMWTEIGHRTEAEITEHDARYQRWMRPRLRSHEVVGFVAEGPKGNPLASGLVWFRSDQPRPKIPTLTIPYILSMYTSEDWRGRGVASAIVHRLVAACRDRGYPSVVLHASEQGRSVYRHLGFERTWEMRYWIDPRLRQRRALMAAKAARKRKRKKGLDRAP